MMLNIVMNDSMRADWVREIPSSTPKGMAYYQDDAVAGAAQTVNGRQVPEGSSPARGLAEGLQTQGQDVFRYDWIWRVLGPRSVGPDARVDRGGTEEETTDDYQPAARETDEQESVPPSRNTQQLRDAWRDNRRPDATCSLQQAGSQPQPPPEPAANGRLKGYESKGLSYGQKNAKSNEEVPDLADHSHHAHTDQIQHTATEHDGAGPEPVSHHAGNRRHQGPDQVVNANCPADDGHAPAEVSILVAERDNHDSRGHTDGLADDLHHYQDDQDDPGAMKSERELLRLAVPYHSFAWSNLRSSVKRTRLQETLSPPGIREGLVRTLSNGSNPESGLP